MPESFEIPVASDRPLEVIGDSAISLVDGKAESTPGWEWAMMMSGLSSAIKRYNAALGVKTSLEARIAAGEALWWIASANEFLLGRISGLRPAEYYRGLGETKTGRQIGGLVYLRNRAGHQFIKGLSVTDEVSQKLAIVDDEGNHLRDVTLRRTVTYPMRPHMTAPSGGFRFPDALPPASSNHRETLNRDRYYSQELAGGLVHQVLPSIHGALDRALHFDWDAEDHLSMSVLVRRM
ncbi:hypothetical protein [Micromonospora marina]|uniref:hypothetical protein n=1 Tax=Micromonospora marina TaxID=307120 RepID=UPI0034515D14